MSAELIEWIVRLSPPVSGDSRKELVSVARAHGWGIREFGRLVADSRLQQPLLEVLRNVELAALCRVWRNDFGDLQATAVRREGASPAIFSPPHRQGDGGRINGIASPHAYGDRCEEGQNGQVLLHSTYVAEREARQQERPRSPTSELRDTRSAASRSLLSPTSLFQEGLQGLPQVQGLRDLGLSPAYAVAVSLDGGSVYVAGAGGLARFLLPSLELAAHSPYVGRASALGYAEVVAGQGFVVCVDIEGALTEHDPDTCDLRCHRSYQPSVIEQSQRVVGGQLRRFTESVCGLEGGFGGAPRLAAAGSTVYLGGSAMAPKASASAPWPLRRPPGGSIAQCSRRCTCWCCLRCGHQRSSEEVLGCPSSARSAASRSPKMAAWRLQGILAGRGCTSGTRRLGSGWPAWSFQAVGVLLATSRSPLAIGSFVHPRIAAASSPTASVAGCHPAVWRRAAEAAPWPPSPGAHNMS